MNSFSHFTKIELTSDTPARILFPGAKNLPEQSFGYIRSERLERLCQKTTGRFQSDKGMIPYKDYPESVPVDIADYLPDLNDSAHQLIISARNVMNETYYAARIQGRWFFRQDSPTTPKNWPVVSVSSKGMRFKEMQHASPEEDLLVGLPLIIKRKPVSKKFLIKHCSDVAHSFEVHPKGLIGPSANAWRELSELWQTLKDNDADENEFAYKMESLAAAHGAKPSQNLLHSIAAQSGNGDIVFFAITGSLAEIASELIEHNVENAFVLDNGGSTNYAVFTPDSISGGYNKHTLVSGPNHRPKGTVFIVFQLDDFLQPTGWAGSRP